MLTSLRAGPARAACILQRPGVAYQAGLGSNDPSESRGFLAQFFDVVDGGLPILQEEDVRGQGSQREDGRWLLGRR